ncbi:penicillin acylase family protein [Kordiimonas aestuarii]|uniref:penicillin acylase family protein n=1 Tax=Kordiimonas aestuarii TaxID=1005925 RepID=UPI0021D051DF|nr:penicillin acylase family protein [Kordiimonas aestuarii]
MRALKFWSLVVGSLIILIGLLGTAWLRSSLPQMDGILELEGPSAPITIARHAHGIPHIGAAQDNDLYFGMGYVHAQDRLWQMEMNRRIGHGRVAEVLGEAGLGFDRYFRTLGFTEAAESALAGLDSETRASLEAYAAGVNAYIDTHKGAWPPEFILTGTTPTHWSPVDTLVWQKMMWLDLSGNMRSELARARLLAKLSPAHVHSIYPSYPGEVETPLPELGALYGETDIESAIALVGEEKPEGYGSNNWVVDGSHTKSGKPLLANDPHLGLTTPSIWYLVRLNNTTTGENLVGVSFPGTPSIILGRNDKIAWGFTNTAPDIQDLYLEKVLNDGKQYLTPDGPADFVIRTEVIKVKDGEDVMLEVKETRHGPVVSNVLGDNTDFVRDGYVLALRWTALNSEDTAPTGLAKLGKAQDFESFKAAGQHYFGPEQNMIYADTEGNIGYYAPALVPVRKPENEIMGRVPSPGWLAKYDWDGYVPYDELPTRYNPESGVIATANEKIVDGDYPHYITRDWALPYRGNRIRAELESVPHHDRSTFKALHHDVTSDMARDIITVLKPHLKGLNPAADAMLRWDGTMDARRTEPLIFHEFMRTYQRLMMADELGDLADDFKSIRPRLVRDSLYYDLPEAARPDLTADYYHLSPIPEDEAGLWCDDVTTNGKETCGELVKTAFDETMKTLATRNTGDWETWQWGHEHTLTQSHRPMSEVAPLARFFEIKTPIAGSRNTINVAGVSENPGSLNASTFGPSYRGIFDLSDLDASLYVLPTGQSGNPLSDKYDDLFPLWRSGNYITIPANAPVTKGARHTLVINPASTDSP